MGILNVTPDSFSDGGIYLDQDKAVARAAFEAGAGIVNDISALRFDPDMAAAAARFGAAVILMHMQGTPRTMQDAPHYEDVVAEVARFLAGRAAAAGTAGIDPAGVCLDPGIGFGKALEHNLALLRGLPDLVELGHPVMVGASRKRFLADILGPLPAGERDAASTAAHVLAIAGGAAVIRLHNVVAGLQAARVADAIVRAVAARG